MCWNFFWNPQPPSWDKKYPAAGAEVNMRYSIWMLISAPLSVLSTWSTTSTETSSTSPGLVWMSCRVQCDTSVTQRNCESLFFCLSERNVSKEHKTDKSLELWRSLLCHVVAAENKSGRASRQPRVRLCRRRVTMIMGKIKFSLQLWRSLHGWQLKMSTKKHNGFWHLCYIFWGKFSHKSFLLYAKAD